MNKSFYRFAILCFFVFTTANAEEANGGIVSPLAGTSVSTYSWNSPVWQFSGYQSVFQANLMPPYSGSFEAAGLGVFFIPANIETDWVTVSFGVAVDTQDMEWAEGRISGGGTAWAFNLGPATFQDGVTLYRGTTDMVPHQIEDIIAGRTQFEIINRPDYDHLQGAIAAVPEPPWIALMAIGLLMLTIPRFGSVLRKQELRG